MDGTLVDSGALHFEAWRATMADLGRGLTRAEFDATFGQRNDTILRRLVDPAISAAEVIRIGDAKEAHYRDLVRARGITLLPGVRDWLERLHSAGWRQAIASSGPRLNSETIIGALDLGEFFAAIVAAEDVTYGKPHPEVFLTAAARLGVAPADCIVVEDAPPGLEAGRRAGMATLAVLSSHPSLAADRVVASFTDLEPDAFELLLVR
jgi:HAD superfamily hydrolase (TIGR01509 family)